MDGNGQLVTKEGHPVLAQSTEGADIATRVIKVNPGQNISIADDGQVFQGQELIGRLSVVEVKDKDSLQKIGNSLYQFKSNSQPEFTSANAPSLKQGYLEQSNVNIVQEMTDMINTTRTFESTQKAISAYDSMADKLVNVVGKSN